ncbi:hypothetical protein M3Y99_01704100 [Aphelenchoides fujianensis]|nr:hypothetical protein M3Y99_01704100 [Aphelenchoides fujianensis]
MNTLHSLLVVLAVFHVTFGLEHVLNEDPLAEIEEHIALSPPVAVFQQRQRAVCMDVYTKCKKWAKNGGCKSRKYTEDAKRSICGVSCKRCKKPTNGEAAGAAPSGPPPELLKAMGEIQKPLFNLIKNLDTLTTMALQKLQEFAKEGQKQQKPSG